MHQHGCQHRSAWKNPPPLFSPPHNALCNNPVSSDEILKALRSLSINIQIIVLSNVSRENVCTSDLYISVTSSSDELLTFSFLLAPLQLFNWTCIFPSHTFSPSFAFPFPFSSSFFYLRGKVNIFHSILLPCFLYIFRTFSTVTSSFFQPSGQRSNCRHHLAVSKRFLWSVSSTLISHFQLVRLPSPFFSSSLLQLPTYNSSHRALRLISVRQPPPPQRDTPLPPPPPIIPQSYIHHMWSM